MPDTRVAEEKFDLPQLDHSPLKESYKGLKPIASLRLRKHED
jgi:hypothetical protein